MSNPVPPIIIPCVSYHFATLLCMVRVFLLPFYSLVLPGVITATSIVKFSSFHSGVSVSRGDTDWAILSFQIPNHRVSSQGHCFPLRKRSRCSGLGFHLRSLKALTLPKRFFLGWDLTCLFLHHVLEVCTEGEYPPVNPFTHDSFPQQTATE